MLVEAKFVLLPQSEEQSQREEGTSKDPRQRVNPASVCEVRDPLALGLRVRLNPVHVDIRAHLDDMLGDYYAQPKHVAL